VFSVRKRRQTTAQFPHSTEYCWQSIQNSLDREALFSLGFYS
jgi:hypothetical protein